MENEEKYGLTLEQMQALGGVIKEKVKELTTDDYDYPDNNPTGIAMWRLKAGLYYLPGDVVGYTQVYFNVPQTAFKGTWLITDGLFGGTSAKGMYLFNGVDTPQYYVAKASDGSRLLGQTFFEKPIDNLTSSDTGRGLAANQGRVLKGLVDSLAIRGAGAPTTSTVGQVGTLYEDTTNGDLYICTDATNPYVWEGVGGGGSITPVQTTGTSTTDVMSQNAVTSMVYTDPATKQRILIGGTTNGSDGSIVIGVEAQGGSRSSNDVVVGYKAYAYNGDHNVSIGAEARTTSNASYAMALGSFSKATVKGQVDISTLASTNTYGYNNSQYRLLTGLYDPQSDHDAATKGYVDPSTDTTAPTTSTVGRLGEIRIDTSTNTAYMCVSADDVTPAYEWKQITA